MARGGVLVYVAVGCLGLIIVGIIGAYLAYRFVVQPMFASQQAPAAFATAQVVTGSGVLSKHEYYSDPSLGTIGDVARGQLDGSPGEETGIAGSGGAVLLDDSGTPKSSVQFAGRAVHVDIIDVEGDGVCEFMSRGSWAIPASVFRHDGTVAWTYGDGTSGVDDMSEGDINGDGLLEFVVGFNGGDGVHLLDDAGRLLWQRPDGNVWHVEMLDTDGNGTLEIAHSNAAGQLTVRDASGRILNQWEPSSYFSDFSLCAWPTRHDRQYALSAEDDTIWLLDCAGARTAATFDAPDAGELGEAYGTPVKLDPGRADYLAVAVAFDNWDRSVLYVYDDAGALVYEEVLPEVCSTLTTRGLSDGGEALLLGGDGRVWEYRASGR